VAASKFGRYRINVAFHLRRNYGWTNAGSKQWLEDNRDYVVSLYEVATAASEAAKVIDERNGGRAKQV
jgi:hypothetical protein